MRVQAQGSLEIVHVAETIRGGIATYLREILSCQVRRFGMGRIAVIVPRHQVQDLGEQQGVFVLAIKPSRIRAVTAWRARRCLDRLMAQTPARIIHVHSSFAGISCRARLFRSKGSRRMVYCPHGWSFIRTGYGAFVARVVERILSTRCDMIVCVSEAERATALQAGLPPDKLSVIRHGLPDRDSGLQVPADPFAIPPLRLVFVGRFDHAKGFDVFLQALRYLKRRVEVQVFGEAVLRDSITETVPETVRLQGWQSFDAIEPYLLGCDALVMPSRWEALGLSGLEAMRAGKAIIASRVGGLVELVENGVTGILVPPEDASALAEVLESVDVELLKQMGVRARQRFMDQFNIERCEEQLAALYEHCMSR